MNQLINDHDINIDQQVNDHSELDNYNSSYIDDNGNMNIK